ncbi:unnamed protein product [Rodentolepis nana]|uniref:C2 domain-containing protein n=1 Tax=Rodentolepis nana TaxID=102285 RepID=A0A0R3TXD7_RODNA|nr:unnamed protein product [Rodentolepis nana]
MSIVEEEEEEDVDIYPLQFRRLAHSDVISRVTNVTTNLSPYLLYSFSGHEWQAKRSMITGDKAETKFSHDIQLPVGTLRQHDHNTDQTETSTIRGSLCPIQYNKP